MKIKTMAIVAIITLLLCTQTANAQLKVDAQGDIGLKTSSPAAGAEVHLNSSAGQYGWSIYTSTVHPESKNYIVGLNGTLKFWVLGNGTCWSSTYGTFSDEKLKTNIKKIESALEKVKKLDGVTYNKKPEKNEKNYSREHDTQEEPQPGPTELGLIAQDVEKVVPEVVMFADESGLKGISYDRLVALLIEAIKEQDSKITEQENKIAELSENMEKSNSKLKSGSKTSAIDNNTSAVSAVLYQNNPNPFSEETTISYVIPDEVQKAKICIYDTNGTLVKCRDIAERGKSSFTIQGSELGAGLYFYTLITDGTVVSTLNMVLTQ